MKKFLLFTACFVVTFQVLRAQPDSLGREIMAHTSPSVRISNGRQMFLEEIAAGNEQKAREVRNYLIAQAYGSPYIAFTDREYFLSLYLTHDYDEVLANSTLVNSSFFARQSWQMPDPRIAPAYDELAMRMRTIAVFSSMELEEQIDRAVPEVEQREYLKMLLTWLTAQDTGYSDAAILREVSDKARDYLAEYPHTPYKPFLIDHMIYDFETDKWGWGLFFGVGPVFLDGLTSRNFNTPFGLMMGGDALYRNLYMGVGLHIAGSRLKNNLVFGGYDFAPKDKLTLFGLDLRLGYKVLETPRFTLVPYGAVGLAGMDLRRKSDEDFNVGKSTLGYGGGVYLDIKFPGRYSSDYLLTGRLDSYTCLRLRYHLTCANYSMPGARNSLVHWVSVEFAGLTRKTHRVRRNK